MEMWLVDQVLQKKRKHTYTAIMSEKDGVTLNVSVDNTLFVEDRQGFQDRQAHRSNLLLVHPESRWRQNKHRHHCFSPSQYLNGITTVFKDVASAPNATTVQAMISHGNNAP